MQYKLIAIAVALGLQGTALLKLHLDQVEEAAWGGKPVILTALTGDLPAGTRLQADHLAEAALPERYVETRHVPYARREDLLGLPVAGPLKAGELLLWSDIAGMHADARKLSGLVSEGMRAVPISAGPESFSRLIQPGDHVDVLLSRDAAGAPETRTLLEDLLVLSVGGDLGAGDGARHRGGRVTVSVTPAQSHILASAEQEGALRLSLRNPADHLLRGHGDDE